MSCDARYPFFLFFAAVEKGMEEHGGREAVDGDDVLYNPGTK
jgi:hypothetical protein